MKTYHEFYNLPNEAKGCTILIGNFDGVHKGHQELINKGKEIAQTNGSKLGVITFSPHPRKFFQKEAYNFYLTEPSMKLRLLEKAGVSNLFVIDFNKDNANLTANNFVRLLADDLEIKHLIVGENFCFGAKRQGNIQTLERAVKRGKFDLTVVDLLKDASGETISSSRIRSFLQTGNIVEANNLLGWDWQVESEIIVGDKRGRQLGYPTANQQINEYIRIPFGVYLTKVQIEGENNWRHGISNFGIRPTFKTKTILLETHIFDFNEEIYGKKMRTIPMMRIRDEKRFKTRECLVKAIEEDCTKAKAVLKSA